MSSKVEQFMESPLVAWVCTFDEFPTVSTVADIADAVLLNRVMNAVDTATYTMTKVNRVVGDDLQRRLQNLQLLVQRILHFYESSLQFLVITPLPNVTVISQDPEGDYSLDELDKLMMLLLGCVVMCEGKGPLIEKMKGMELTQQQALVAHIQQITDTTEYVCSVDWTELEDLPKSNVEALCRQVYLYLQRVAKERDRHYEAIIEVTQERDFFKAQQLTAMSSDGSNSEAASARSSLLYSPMNQGPQINQDLLETKGKLRLLQDQVDRKNEIISETKEELEQARVNLSKMQQERRSLLEEAQSARGFRDELEALRVRAARCDRLESDMLRYKQKIEDLEYFKKKIMDLKQQNELMTETKLLLEEKGQSLERKLLDYDDLCVDNAGFKVQLDTVNEEKKVDQQRVGELLGHNAQLELENCDLQERLSLLTQQLEEEQGKNTEIMSTSLEANLSVEVSEAEMVAQAKLLRLERETRDMEKNAAALRQSQAKIAELEKGNRRLYEKSHEDKKEIIKLKEEVEILKVKAGRVDKLQGELSTQKERIDEVNRLQAKLKEVKQSKEAAVEAKATMEDELQALKHKLVLLNVVQEENASLKAQADTCVTQHEEDQKLTEFLIAKNAQLELELQKSLEDITLLTSNLEQKESHGSASLAPTIISPPRVSETEMAAKAKLQRLEKETKEMEKSLETLSHAQAKLAEMERVNKKLHAQSLEDKKGTFKLKEELEDARNRVTKGDLLKVAVRELEQKLEEKELTIQELKQQHQLIMDRKVVLEEELLNQQTTTEKIGSLENANSELAINLEQVQEEKEEQLLRMEELLTETSELHLAKERMEVDLQVLRAELEHVQQRSSVSTPPSTPNGAAPLPPPRSPDNILTKSEMVTKAKLLRLESYNRELEKSLEAVKVNGSPAPEEVKKTQADRKEVLRLREELKGERAHVSHLKSEVTKFREQRRKEREDSFSEEKQQDRYKQLESKKGEAFAQSLANKEERIQVLEGRLEQVTSNSTKLMEELQISRKQYEKLKSYMKSTSSTNSLRRDSSTAKLAPGDVEVSKLREKVKELSRVREKMRASQEENNMLLHEMMDNKQLVVELEAQNNKLLDRIEIQEQLIHTLEEENKQLLQQTNKLLAQNQDLLMNTLQSKDRCLEDEKMFSYKLDELERDRSRLAQVQTAQRRVLESEIEKLKRNQKKKSVLKRSIRKIKGRFKNQSGTRILENPDSGGASVTTSNSSLSPTSSSTRFSTVPDGGSPHSTVSRLSDQQSIVPNMEASPQGKRNKFSITGTSSPLHSESVMTLEDFLMESNKTPKSRRKYMEINSAMATYSGGSNAPGGSGAPESQQLNDSFEPRMDNIEMPKFLRRSSPSSFESDETGKPVELAVGSQLSQTDSDSMSSIKNRSDYSLGSSGMGLNINSNNNNGENEYESNYVLRPISPCGYPSAKPPLPLATRRTYSEGRQYSDPTLPGAKKQYLAVKTADGPSSSLLVAQQKTKSLPKSRSSDQLLGEVESFDSTNRPLKRKSASLELLDANNNNSMVVRRNERRSDGKPPLGAGRRPLPRHRYSSPIIDSAPSPHNSSQKSDDSYWFEYGCV